MLTCLLKHFILDESGQSMMEYASVMAFVVLLVATVSPLAQNSLSPALKNLFSSFATSVNQLQTLH